jgi:S1-C subfamily serine protease
VTLAIRRGGNTLTVQPVLGKFQHPYPIIASVRPEAIYGMWVDYSSITVQQMFGPGARFQPRLEGVIVREFEKDSPAERAFSQLPPPQGRWLILRVDNKPVATPKDFYNVVGKNATFRLTVTASFDPAGRTYTVKLP